MPFIPVVCQSLVVCYLTGMSRLTILAQKGRQGRSGWTSTDDEEPCCCFRVFSRSHIAAFIYRDCSNYDKCWVFC